MVNSAAYRRIASRPSRMKFSLLAASFMLVSCLAYSSTLKMEAICSSKTSADFHRTTRRYIADNRTFQEETTLWILRLIYDNSYLFGQAGDYARISPFVAKEKACCPCIFSKSSHALCRRLTKMIQMSRLQELT
jgi:hypothetical protein